ncbi:MAG: PAS domain S-box protein [Verrucomicrobiota bacterium]
MFEHVILVANITLLGFGAYLLTDLARPWLVPQKFRPGLRCLSYAVMAVVTLIFSPSVQSGVTIDAGGTIIAVATLLGGFKCGAVTSAASLVMHALLGGVGAPAGGLGTICDYFASAGLLCVLRRWQPDWIRHLLGLLLAGLAVGLSEALSLLLVRPLEHGLALFLRYGLELFFCQVACAVVLGGLILLYEGRRPAIRQYHAALDTTMDGFLWVSRAEYILEVNHTLCTLTGYPEADLLGLPLARLQADPAAADVHISMAARLRQHSPLWFESRWRRKDGSLLNVELSLALAGDNGEFHLFVRDITERKRVENALRDSESRANEKADLLKAIMESPQGIIVFSLDRDYRYTEFTLGHQQTINKIWGVEIKIGMNMLEVIGTPEDRARAKVNFDRVLHGEHLLVVEEYGDQSLQREWYENRYDPILDSTGAISGLTVFVTNITARKLAEAALQESEAHFRALADSGQALVWAAGLDKKCHYFNRPWLEFTGRTLEQEWGDGWAKGVHPDDLPNCLRTYGEAFDRRERFSMDYRFRRFDGVYRWIHDNGTPHYNSQGEFIGYIGHCLDITDLKHAEALLHQTLNQVRHLNEVLLAIRDIAGLLNREHDRQKILDGVCRSLCHTRGYVIVWIGQPEEASGEIKPVAHAGANFELHAPIRWDDSALGQGPTGIALRERRPVVFADLANDPRFAPWRGPAMMAGAASITSVPLLHKERLFGVLTVKADRVNAFDTQEVDLLLDLAGKVARALKALEDESSRKAGDATLARYQLLSDNAKDIILFVRPPEGQIIEVNRAACEAYGYDRAGLLTKTIYDLRPADAKTRVAQQMENARRDGMLFETVHVRQDGRPFPVEVSSRATLIDGEPILLSVIRDITERKKAEQELRTLNQQLEQRVRERTAEALSLYHNAPCGYHSVGPDGVMLQMNDTELNWLGYRREEVEGRLHFTELLTPQSAARFNERFLPFVETGTVNQYEWELRGKDGSSLVVLVDTVAVRDADGRFLRSRSAVTNITERKRMEVTLMEERHRLAGIIEGTNVGTWEWNVQTGETIFNERWANMIGYTLEELAPVSIATWMKFAHPDDLQASSAMLENHFSGKLDYYEFEARMRHKDGSWVWVLDRGKVTSWTETGKPLHMRGTHQDITQRKWSELLLQNITSRLSLAAQAGGVGIWDYYVANNQLVWDDQMFRLYGITRDQFSGVYAAWQAGVHPEDRQRGDEEIQRALRGEKNFDTEFRVVWPDGSIHNIRALAQVQRDAAGQPEHLIGTNWDITVQKQLEAKLKSSEENFRTFFETIGDLIVVATPEGRIQFVNQSLKRKLGYGEADLATMHVLDLHPAVVRPEAREIFAAMFRGEREYCPLPMVKRNGTPIPVETRVWFGRWNGEQCIFGVSKDLSAEQEAQQRFERLFRNNPTLMALSTLPDRQFSDVNDAFLNALGYSKEEIIGRTAGELGIFVEPERQAAAADTLLANHRVADLELEVRCKDGTIISGLFSGEVITSQGQQYFLTVMIDITKRKRLEQTLLASETKFRRLVEMAPLPLALLDVNGHTQLINDQFTRVLGYTLADLPTLEVWWPKAYPESGYRHQVREQWVAAAAQAMQGTGLMASKELNVTCKDGTVRTMLITGSVMKDHFLVALLDVTTLKRANDKLRKLSLAVEHSPSMILITDVQGRIEYVNPAWSQTTGYCLEEVQGKTSRFLKSGVQSDAFYAHLWAEITAGRIWRGELCNRRKDGSLYWETIAIAPVVDEAGRTTHFVGVKEDSSQRKQMENELRWAKETADSANRAKSTFLANMSHEIRTPMNAILGFTQLLMRDAELSGLQRQQLTTITRSGEHLMDIISDILEMARIESVRLILHPSNFDLHLLLDDLEHLFHQRSSAKHLHFNVELQIDVPRCVQTDETKLRQVLINLLGNAMKFTAQGGTVILRVSFQADADGSEYLHAEVEDTGAGIAPEDIPHVFEPFFQTNTGRQTTGGTGLGLPISREFIRLMGGDIHVISRVGMGSMFSFKVRVTRAEETAVPNPTTPTRRVLRLLPELPACRVLVVDDQQENLDLLVQMLAPTGFEVRTERHGADALAQCQAWLPHVVLLDSCMPEMDGFEVLRQIRLAHGRTVKIIELSADLLLEQQRRAVAEGADVFMGKPFKEADLLETIKQLTSVDYIYGDSPPTQITASPPPLAGLPLAEAIGGLPPALLVQLRDATDCLDHDATLALVEQVTIQDATLGRQLHQLTKQFDYGTLQKMLSPEIPKQ